MEDFFENELIKRFEQMIENNEEFYFDTEELEEIIIHYLELGDISYAERAYKYAEKLHPESLEIKIKKLEVLLELEQYKAAKDLINELSPSSSNHLDFLVCCAKYYSNLGHSQKAIDFCLRALQQEEEQNFLHNFIADEYVNLRDPFNALKHYKKALSYDPSDDYSLENCMVCYHDMKRSNEAIDFLNEYLDRFPYSETAWFEYGQYFFNKKKFQEALRGFDYLLAINPNSMGVYSNKAACFEAMKDFEKAISVYEELLEVEVTKSFTYYKIGLCYRELKQPINALVSFQKSLIEDPQFYLSMMEQSFLYEEMGAMKEALHFAKEATSLNENNVDYLKRLAFLYIDSGKLEESILCLKKIVKLEPKQFYNWYAFAEVLMLIGEHQDALEILTEATKKHQRAELFYQMSNCYFHLKHDADGRKSLETALGLDADILEDMKMKYPFIKSETDKEKTKKK